MADVQTTIIMAVMSLLAGWLGAAWVQRNAVRLKLVSIPNHRSLHTQPTPNSGGLGIVMGGSLAGAWLGWGQWWGWWGMAGLALALAVVGLADDIRHVPARIRFTVQVLLVGLLLWLVGAANGEGVFIAALLLAGVWWINLFNFMDGIDGIAGSQAIFMLAAAALLGGWFHPDVAATATSWQWMVALGAATAGFLVLNWPPARVFMGDAGSTYLAFMIAGLALVSVREGWMTYESWIILGAVFIVDATVTLIRRMVAMERWAEAHRSHAYQHLARRFGAHLPVTGIVIVVNMVWLAPLAWLSLLRPELAWIVVGVAYLPLVVATWLLGAGKREKA